MPLALWSKKKKAKPIEDEGIVHQLLSELDLEPAPFETAARCYAPWASRPDVRSALQAMQDSGWIEPVPERPVGNWVRTSGSGRVELTLLNERLS